MVIWEMSVYKNGQAMKEVRPVLSRASLVGAVFGFFSLAPAARAQVASTPPVPGSAAGWTFSITPYAWLPTVSTTYSYTGPRGVFSVTNTINAGIGDYISELNFGLMLGGEARYDRFTIMTDLVYANASITTKNSHLSSVNLGLAPIDIPRDLQVSTGTRLATTIWSVAGGYTLLEGDWGTLMLWSAYARSSWARRATTLSLPPSSRPTRRLPWPAAAASTWV